MKRKIDGAGRDVSRYLDEVLDLKHEERHAWVDALAAREPDMAAEVRSYLTKLAELEMELYTSDGFRTNG